MCQRDRGRQLCATPGTSHLLKVAQDPVHDLDADLQLPREVVLHHPLAPGEGVQHDYPQAYVRLLQRAARLRAHQQLCDHKNAALAAAARSTGRPAEAAGAVEPPGVPSSCRQLRLRPAARRRGAGTGRRRTPWPAGGPACGTCPAQSAPPSREPYDESRECRPEREQAKHGAGLCAGADQPAAADSLSLVRAAGRGITQAPRAGCGTRQPSLQPASADRESRVAWLSDGLVVFSQGPWGRMSAATPGFTTHRVILL